MTTLADILRGIEGGVFPAPDLSITVVPAPSGREACVVALTAHIVIAADVSPTWVAERIPDGNLSAPLNPPFLYALEQLTGRRVSAIDQMLLAPALTDPTERAAAVEGLVELTDRDHPRIERAWRYRDDVHAYTAPYGGLVLTGRGLAGRLEVALEVPDSARGRGHGRQLARAARALIPPSTHIWAQVSPGNAASTRTFLSAGYQPVGSEALLVK
ncbi:GNAT family N-acetyltransferase [Streptomyces sp. SID13031]|uniref:GNAT family N-acetyltransferase n=1 Tax=Streptomyces sp. SID13031 TaxID=2706046 RepID=UPI0013CADAC2|nr:GNAT family N-acetyltransferase [Streptomyces sp. SID13031]NEA33188.1 GNAT family N-acetyltransferase [Streptomyces sp. SID13031]